MRQLSFLEELESENWTADDWETPNNVAGAIARLIRPGERCLEPAAGNGQIAKHLPPGSVCVEIKSNRVRRGQAIAPHCQWIQEDFLAMQILSKVDVVVTNPPFSRCVEFIKKGLSVLDPDNPKARLIFLLPLDWNCSKERGNAWRRLNAYIHDEYRIMGRVHYLDQSGVPQPQRQVCDAVFDIRHGSEKHVKYLF